jgi:phosphoglycolate phosphatase-like HAD superfamily hydrolase
LMLDYLGLKSRFDIIIGSRNGYRGKPEPDLIMLAMKKLKATPKYTVFVGDTMYDMLAAKKAGCITLGFRFNEGIIRIDDLAELPAVVDKIKKSNE